MYCVKTDCSYALLLDRLLSKQLHREGHLMDGLGRVDVTKGLGKCTTTPTPGFRIGKSEWTESERGNKKLLFANRK